MTGQATWHEACKVATVHMLEVALQSGQMHRSQRLGKEWAKRQEETLCLILFFGHGKRHVGSYFPERGSNLRLLHWTLGVLTTGPLGKS